MHDIFERAQAAATFIRSKVRVKAPAIGLMLGTGLSDLTAQWAVSASIPYADIPYFPNPTVASHLGNLLVVQLGSQTIIVLAGRFHYYEGYQMQQVTFPVRVLACLGVNRLILSNAAGGLQAHFSEGDVVVIKDHINLMAAHPLRGRNEDRWGVRFPDMLHTYDAELRRKFLRIAADQGLSVHEGVYAAVQGPSLETPAEYEYLHRIGADVVGMSTVPEVLVARHVDMTVFAVSVVSNVCYPIEKLTTTTVEHVIATVQQASDQLQVVMEAFIKEL